MGKQYLFEEVQQHRSADSCWVVLYDQVYDVTEFLSEHPGGSKVILQLAGQDATEAYDPIHPAGTLESSLPPSCKLGPIDTSTIPVKPQEPRATENSQDSLMTLSQCLNMDDIEKLATSKLSKRAWSYYYSAADDLLSKEGNNRVYQRILLRPRVFIDVTKADTSTSLLGNKVNLPVFISPAAQARLGDPSGEHGIATACAKYGACQIISNNASQTPEEICANAPDGQVFGWQLYIQMDRQKSIKMLERVKKIEAIKFIVLTLDAPVPGKREHDERAGDTSVGSTLPVSSSVKQGSQASSSINPKSTGGDQDGAPSTPGATGGVGKSLFAGTACDLTWANTLPWLKEHLPDMPIVLKGLQTHDDAYIASQHPQIKGILLSNHGGRAADTAPPSIHTLLEIRKYCPEVFDKLEVYVDGGIKRGTDVVKAIALGATAVGIGRSALYGLSAGGPEGVERVLEILKAEIETAMRLLGVERLDQLRSHHVNSRMVEQEIYHASDNSEKAQTWIQSKL